MEELIHLNGTIDRIIYENIENGFYIFTLTHKQQSITVKGTVPSIKAGQEVVVTGKWITHPKFGKQFDAQRCAVSLPTNLIGIKKYLSSGIIKGIGPTYAQKLIDAFGIKVLEVIDNKPEKLKSVPGIGPKRIKQIISGWKEQKEVAHIMIFLQEKDITPAYAAKIYKRYGHESVAILKENPYRLAEEIWGIGFKTADQIAHNLGFEDNDPARIKAGILFAISEAVRNGHLYVEVEKLKNTTQTLLELEPDSKPLIKIALHKLHEIEKIKVLTHQEQHYVTTSQLYHSEFGVAKKLKNLLAYPSALMLDIDQIYQKLRTQKGSIFLNDDQQRAILTTLQSKITIITGGPGTGKTTLIKQLLEILDEKYIKYKLAAPTGRAAKRMQESTGRQAATIHRLLEFDPSTMGFKHNEQNTLQTNILIIDEASMIDIFLAHALLKAIPLATHVVFIGDIDQLPPVGAGNFLRDMIKSNQIDCIRLTEIFRQAQNSLIVVNAHRINSGNFPTTKLSTAKKDFIWIKEEQPEKLREHLYSFFTKRLAQYGVMPSKTMVLVPMNKGIVGTHKLNHELQEIINPIQTKKITYGVTEFKEGDRVMQIRNNYEKLVFNGDIGFIENIETTEKNIVVQFGKRSLIYKTNDLDELVLSYAITIHKSQGSEYDAVIIPLFTQHFTLLARNLIYTAITRAKKLCIFIGQTRALAIAIKNNKSINRQTFLTEFLTTEVQCR